MIVVGEIPAQFNDLKVGPDVTVFCRAASTLAEYTVVYETWFVDHIKAESIIFVATDVDHLSDAELETLVRTSPLVEAGSRITISRSKSDYCFVNFNFKTED
jgi:hypothetical protein